MDRYNLVLKAQEESLKVLKPAVDEEFPWKTAVGVLGKYSKYFTHSLGHGIGLEVHEAPFLRHGSKNLLTSRMLVTVEPGLYFPGWGGIRIEDYVLITKAGNKVLSKTPKRLEEIIIQTRA